VSSSETSSGVETMPGAQTDGADGSTGMLDPETSNMPSGTVMTGE